MTLRPRTRVFLLLLVFASGATLASAQGRRDDYEKAGRFLTESIRDLAYDGMVDPQWIGKTTRFWYRKEGPFGKQFMLVDAAALTSAPAFDHDRIAAELSSATKQSVSARALPFDAIRFTDPSTALGASDRALQFDALGATWTCRLDSYTCTRSSDPFDDEGDIADEGFGHRG